MAIIHQLTFFDPDDLLSDLGDLKRLQLVLHNLPDEPLVSAMEAVRGKTGRNDYPVRMMWNLFIAGIIFQHPSAASLLRELSRNHQLRWVVSGGHMTSETMPSEDAMSRFGKRLMEHQPLIDAMFAEVVDCLRAYVPEFGKRVAIDSKMIQSAARKRSSASHLDGRGEHDADWGAKRYAGVKEDGTAWEKTTWYFGYKLHLLVDSQYEIPLAYHVTTARPHDLPEGKKLMNAYAETNPELHAACGILTADRGYDSKAWADELAQAGITAVIDTKHMWHDSEKPLLDYENLTYNEKGEVTCCCPVSGEVRTMSHNGYEAGRDCIRKQCPMVAYKGMICQGQAHCRARTGVRIPLSFDSRIFTPIPRDTRKWKQEYKRRTAVERVNSRFDVSYGFEHHGIRGLKKMTLRTSLALLVMVTKALEHVKRTPIHEGEYNSLVKMPA